jgi:hypothetical protein
MRKHRNEGNKRELVTSAYFPYDSDDSVPIKEMTSFTTAVAAGERNSSLGEMPMQTTFYE